MQQSFRIVCRGSALSLAQAGIFKRRLLSSFPLAQTEIIIKETRGDLNPLQPLSEMEGKDFFTRDIQDFLLSGQADFAVHSLKDVSGENFFQSNHYAIIEREDPRDVAIFNPTITHKLAHGEKITVGTSSPRRVRMATGFLRKALPVFGKEEPVLETQPIRGNVDTRLQKLTDGEYDGIIIACAGLNRLLRSDQAGTLVAKLLKEKQIMILPLLECPPAPGQGAIVAETAPGNPEAIRALEALNNPVLSQAVDEERKVAHRYGSGCHQEFGVIYVQAKERDFIFAAGRDREGKDFEEVFSSEGLPVWWKLEMKRVNPTDPLFLDQNITLINPETTYQAVAGRMWVSQTQTWFDLAKKGVWVEGSLEGMGLPFIEQTLKSPLVSVKRTEKRP